MRRGCDMARRARLLLGVLLLSLAAAAQRVDDNAVTAAEKRIAA
jgi:hypothetical protein